MLGRALLRIAVTLLVCACATPPLAPPPVRQDIAPEVAPARGPVIARDEEFAVVSIAQGDDLRALAKHYLGDADQSWRIAEFNGIERVRAGDVVVIPLRARNVVGVYPNGFQAVPILCYHRFGTKSSKLTVTKGAFETQMEYLARNGFHVVPLAKVRAFLEAKEPLPEKTVAITIDDGYRSTYEIAFPVLRSYGFPATVFLYSDFVGATDALSWAQMKAMIASGLIEVQPHSKTHANLTLRMADESDGRYRDRVRREVETPITAIRERLEMASATYAYPYGDVNDTVVSELARAGVPLGLTVTPGSNAFFANPYMLRRTMVFGGDDVEAFKAKLTTFVPSAAR